MIDQRDVEKVLHILKIRQVGGLNGNGPLSGLPESCRKTSLEGWKESQIAFARRLAHISAKHAARHRMKITWKHHSIGLLRRLALLVMVSSILAAHYI